MRALGIFLAVTFHLGVLLFGGVFFFTDKEKQARDEEVLLDVDLAEEDEKKPDEEKPEEKPEEPSDAPAEETPQFVPEPNQPIAPTLAALDAGAISALLDGGGGDATFGGPDSLKGGGTIGGPGGERGGPGRIPSASDLDQKPRLTARVDPRPQAKIAKSLPQVTVTVFMNADGNVTKVDVTPAVDASAQKAIVDAVLQWKYEPGMRGGRKVPCKVSHKISFQ